MYIFFFFRPYPPLKEMFPPPQKKLYPKKFHGNGDTIICIGQEVQCLPYARFLQRQSYFKCQHCFSLYVRMCHFQPK